MYLTKRQRDVFNFILRFMRKNGYSPTLEEICKGLGFSSLASVHKHLKNLEAKGIISRKWGHGRSIEIQKNFDFMNAVEVRVVGEVTAGRPIAPEDKRHTISVPLDMLRGKDAFILRVRDDSLREEAIQPGDLLVVERSNTAENGEMVVAILNGKAVFMGRYYKEGGSVRLESANAQLTPLVLPAEELQVRGVVVALLRRYD